VDGCEAVTSLSTIRGMERWGETSIAARRELAVVAVALVLLGRLVEEPWAWPVLGLALVAVAMAGIAVLGSVDPRGVPIESLIVPAVLVAGSAAAIHMIPMGPALIPAAAGVGILVSLVLRLEMRLLAQAAGASEGDRSRVLLAVVVTAFIAFAGVAALVPGGLSEPGGVALVPIGTDPAAALTEEGLLVLALADAFVALLLGYRAASFRYGTVRSALWSALTYAFVIAITAGAVRAVDLPRLAGPAMLALVFYLWHALHGTAPARRREPRFLWETALLGVMGIVVLAWNLQLRP
jgi:hypothetical protein